MYPRRVLWLTWVRTTLGDIYSSISHWYDQRGWCAGNYDVIVGMSILDTLRCKYQECLRMLMSIWKQCCMTHISNLCRRNPACWPLNASFIRENGWHYFQGVVTYRKVFFSGFHLMCPCWCTRLLSLSKKFKQQMRTRSFSLLDDLAGSRNSFQTGNSQNWDVLISFTN